MSDVLKVHLVHDAAQVPEYATEGAAGMDLRACISAPQTLHPGDRAAIPTGIAIALPPGHEAQIRPRSGLALKHGIGMVNAPGTVDVDYRGEVKVILINLGREPFTINHGDRIAQMVIAPVARVRTMVVGSADDLGATVRGEGGMGSTGLR